MQSTFHLGKVTLTVKGYRNDIKFPHLYFCLSWQGGAQSHCSVNSVHTQRIPNTLNTLLAHCSVSLFNWCALKSTLIAFFPRKFSLPQVQPRISVWQIGASIRRIDDRYVLKISLHISFHQMVVTLFNSIPRHKLPKQVEEKKNNEINDRLSKFASFEKKWFLCCLACLYASLGRCCSFSLFLLVCVRFCRGVQTVRMHAVCKAECFCLDFRL